MGFFKEQKRALERVAELENHMTALIKKLDELGEQNAALSKAVSELQERHASVEELENLGAEALRLQVEEQRIFNAGLNSIVNYSGGRRQANNG